MPRKAQDLRNPGTFVFDASLRGRATASTLFCMSLMKEENRGLANEGYLKKFNLTPEQADAISSAGWPDAGARRQHLHRRRRDRRPFVPPSRRRDDRVHAEDCARSARWRPLGRKAISRPGRPAAGKTKSKSKASGKARSKRGWDHAGVASSHVPGHRRAIETADRGAVLEAGVLRLREIQGVDGEGRPASGDRGVQRSPRRSRSKSCRPSRSARG